MQTKSWHLTSWQKKSATQQVLYPEPAELEIVLRELSLLPPLVTPFEIEALQTQLANAAQGKSFLLQGGDCAESFADCNEKTITNKIRILLQMSLILIHGLHKPVIRVGRIAGQYAKPRSSDLETQGNLALPSYRGDLINAPEFTLAARTPDPWRMLQGYQYAALTLNYVRALVAGGFADLFHHEYWELDFVKTVANAQDYHRIVKSLREALQFIKAINAIPNSLRQVEFYISHEALNLSYEQALTREVNEHWYNLGTHFPWIGMRTSQIENAHVEYLRGIRNPVAVKVGPNSTVDWIKSIVEILNPENIAGRLTLITRLGAQQVQDKLPAYIKAVKQTGIQVLWSCDPMHGNTISVKNYKTRKFDDILSELKQTFQIHRELNSHLGGVHFELTGENVTECIGGARNLNEADLKTAYKTLVDPRLNYEQALEMAMLIARDA